MTAADDAALLAAAVEAIGKIVDTIRSAKAGAIDPQAAIAKISSLHDSLLANNATANAEEAAKFKP